MAFLQLYLHIRSWISMGFVGCLVVFEGNFFHGNHRFKQNKNAPPTTCRPLRFHGIVFQSAPFQKNTLGAGRESLSDQGPSISFLKLELRTGGADEIIDVNAEWRRRFNGAPNGRRRHLKRPLAVLIGRSIRSQRFDRSRNPTIDRGSRDRFRDPRRRLTL